VNGYAHYRQIADVLPAARHISPKSEQDLMSDFPWHEADAMFLLLLRRAADLQATEHIASQEEELDCVSNVVAAYEAKRWPARQTPQN
jgi:hypothetical protein